MMPKHLQELLKNGASDYSGDHPSMSAVYRLGFIACYEAMEKMSEDEKKTIKKESDRIATEYNDYGPLTECAAEGIELGLMLGRMNERTKAIREVIEYLRDRMGPVRYSGAATAIESKFLTGEDSHE